MLPNLTVDTSTNMPKNYLDSCAFREINKAATNDGSVIYTIAHTLLAIVYSTWNAVEAGFKHFSATDGQNHLEEAKKWLKHSAKFMAALFGCAIGMKEGAYCRFVPPPKRDIELDEIPHHLKPRKKVPPSQKSLAEVLGDEIFAMPVAKETKEPLPQPALSPYLQMMQALGKLYQ